MIYQIFFPSQIYLLSGDETFYDLNVLPKLWFHPTNRVNEYNLPIYHQISWLKILHVLKDYEYVRVLSVGPTALNSVMTAYRLASREIESLTNGSVLVLRQSEYSAEIAGKKAKGICTRIFAIDIKFAL